MPVRTKRQRTDLPKRGKAETEAFDAPMDALDDLSSSAAASSSDEDSEGEFARETAADKRLRLARRYLDTLEGESKTAVPGSFDAAALDRDLIAERLREDTLEHQGRAFRREAATFAWRKLPSLQPRVLRGHTQSVTAVAMTREYVFSASKDGSIIQWNAATGQRMHTFKRSVKSAKGSKSASKATFKASQEEGHSDHVLCLAVSTDGRFLASGGRDCLVKVWSVGEARLLATFRQHRAPVTALAFRRGANTLFSGSADRSLKVWNIDDLGYVETL